MSSQIDPAAPDAVSGALVAYLAARDDLHEARIVEPPAPLGSGFDSFIYTFRLAGEVADPRWSRPLVLRLQRNAAVAAQVRRQADVQTFLTRAGYPVPALLVAEDAGNAFGLPFMIMERVDGGTVLAGITGNPLRAGRLLTDLGRLHARLHQVTTVGWPLDDGEDPLVSRKLVDMSARVSRLRLGGCDEALAWLERNAPTVLPETAVITHNDYHPMNVLLSKDQALLVIDWSDATLGDRHSDVARTLTLFAFAYIVASSTFERVLLKAARGYLRSRYRRGYEEAFPLDRKRLAYFEALQAAYLLLQLREMLADPRPGAAPSAAAARTMRDLPSLVMQAEAYVRTRIQLARRPLG